MSKNLSHTEFYDHIRQAIRLARRKVAVAVNTAMVESYWHIGQIIVEEEQEGKNSYSSRKIKATWKKNWRPPSWINFRSSCSNWAKVFLL